MNGSIPASCGTSWTNACKSLPAALARGAVYFFADGTYPGYSFDEATQGTEVITIKKATPQDHGTSDGWSDSLGDGQAIIADAELFFATANWIFDGTKGSGKDAGAYGFYVQVSSLITQDRMKLIDIAANNVHVSHVAVECPGPAGDVSQMGISGGGDHVTVSNTLIDNCQANIWSQGDNWIVESTYFARNWGTPANHDVQAMSMNNFTFRNNIVTYCGSQCIEPAGGCTDNMIGAQIYNNVFANIEGTNGVVKGTCNGAIRDSLIYGNTIVHSNGPILYQNNPGGGFGSGNIVKNNLVFDAPGIINESDGGAIEHSHNALFNAGSTAETGGQIGSGDPFVNSATGDYRVAANTQPGAPLPAPFDRDINGKLRATWSRGAFEF